MNRGYGRFGSVTFTGKTMNGKQKRKNSKNRKWRCGIWFFAVLLLLGGGISIYVREHKEIKTGATMPVEQENPTPAITPQQTMAPKEILIPHETVPPQETLMPVQERKTIENLLRTALAPVGNTMYVWGGGWNEEDTGAGTEAVTLGVSPRWAEFAAMQDASYDYNRTRYQIHDGLDCSGYIGWCVYNVMEQESGKTGYVGKAKDMALAFSKYGWGSFTEASEVKDWKAGDIMSMKGHVFMVVGACSDGSVVFVHSSPPGVSMAGTLQKDSSRSEAVELAEQYMSTYFPDWYAKYPNCEREYTYISTASAMRWNRETLADEEGLTELPAKEVLERIFINFNSTE